MQFWGPSKAESSFTNVTVLQNGSFLFRAPIIFLYAQSSDQERCQPTFMDHVHEETDGQKSSDIIILGKKKSHQFWGVELAMMMVYSAPTTLGGDISYTTELPPYYSDTSSLSIIHPTFNTESMWKAVEVFPAASENFQSFLLLYFATRSWLLEFCPHQNHR